MEFTDHLNRTIVLPKHPERIISLVPSQTELLVDLGLEEKIVGITKFCVHPAHLRKSKTIVGGTKNYRFEVIESLKPDLIIGNKEENEHAGIERLAESFPVWMSDISTFGDSLKMILDVGELTGTPKEAKKIADQISKGLSEELPYKGSAIYLIWNKPIMVAGQDTFINVTMGKAGFKNLVESKRYPELSIEQIQELKPEYLLLSSEPFPFKEKHLKYYQNYFPNTKVKIVDGELFSWYGSRLLKSKAYFDTLK